MPSQLVTLTHNTIKQSQQIISTYDAALEFRTNFIYANSVRASRYTNEMKRIEKCVFNFLYISLPSSAKQQREMTKLVQGFVENVNTRR